ncbi:hypothetical protein [Alkalicoccobacillus porphyridii]|nr:hypothetical protein [Alkalicoccobacillus porphyridii]
MEHVASVGFPFGSIFVQILGFAILLFFFYFAFIGLKAIRKYLKS